GLADSITGDPKLGPLADNGGPTQTMALLPGSPALNAAGPALAPATDQRGFARGAAPDIGAYEASHLIVVTTTADEDDGSADPAPGAGTSLREAINLANGAPGSSLTSGDTIVFDRSLAGQTVNLTRVGDSSVGPSALAVSTTLTIQGMTGASNIT